MQIPGDFADVLTYLAMLFAKKRMKQIEISGYRVEYNSYRILGQDMSESAHITEFPPADNVDRVSCLVLSAGIKLGKAPVRVTIRWDFYEFDADISKEEAERFIDRIDQSTFRYF
ncbi:MAG: hypothetical protein ACP5OC_04175 [Thermoplasmata archaeon]